MLVWTILGRLHNALLLSVVCSVDMCIKMNHILFVSHCLSTLVSQALLGPSMHIFNSLLLPNESWSNLVLINFDVQNSAQSYIPCFTGKIFARTLILLSAGRVLQIHAKIAFEFKLLSYQFTTDWPDRVQLFLLSCYTCKTPLYTFRHTVSCTSWPV